MSALATCGPIAVTGSFDRTAKLWSIERPGLPTHVVMPRGVNPLVGTYLAYHKHLLPVRGFKTIRTEDIAAVGGTAKKKRQLEQIDRKYLPLGIRRKLYGRGGFMQQLDEIEESDAQELIILVILVKLS